MRDNNFHTIEQIEHFLTMKPKIIVSQIRVLNSYTNQTNTIRHLWNVLFPYFKIQVLPIKVLKKSLSYIYIYIQLRTVANTLGIFWYLWIEQYSNQNNLRLVGLICIFGRVKRKNKQLIMTNDNNKKVLSIAKNSVLKCVCKISPLYSRYSNLYVVDINIWLEFPFFFNYSEYHLNSANKLPYAHFSRARLDFKLLLIGDIHHSHMRSV